MNQSDQNKLFEAHAMLSDVLTRLKASDLKCPECGAHLRPAERKLHIELTSCANQLMRLIKENARGPQDPSPAP
jgi:hypothetical protein